MTPFLNHLNEPIITGKNNTPQSTALIVCAMSKWESFTKYFHFLFDKPNDSATKRKGKQNIHLLKENELLQQQQIKEQYELLNLTRVETAGNRKLLRKSDRELLQLNTSFTTLYRETIILISNKIPFQQHYI